MVRSSRLVANFGLSTKPRTSNFELQTTTVRLNYNNKKKRGEPPFLVNLELLLNQINYEQK